MTHIFNRKQFSGLFLGLVIACFGIVSGAKAQSEFFEDNFELYTPAGSDIGGKGYWITLENGYSFVIGTTTVENGLQAMSYSHTGTGAGDLKDGTGIASSTDGAFKFSFYDLGGAPYTSLYFSLTNKNYLTSPERYDNSSLSISIYGDIRISGGMTTTADAIVANTVPLGTWNTVEVEYDYNTRKARAKLEGSDWSDYILLKNEPNITSYFFEGSGAGLSIDNIQWTTGESYGLTCDYGVLCNLCDIEETCTNHNCFWQNQQCWQTRQATTTSWTSYYSEHSSFTTSTIFINFLSGFTAPFLENIQNWLNSFASFFNTANAIHYGEVLGGAIPMARGYLSIFNSFFGDFPISEIFIFFLTALVIFVVYKQIRNLINLIKP